jgi:hypothetical protein
VEVRALIRLAAIALLSLVVALHHGVPVLGHAAHAGAAPAPHGVATSGSGTHPASCAPAGCVEHDTGAGLAAVCLAILAMAAATALAMSRRWRPLVARAVRTRMIVPARALRLPPPHGPPRPIRPCVLLQ